MKRKTINIFVFILMMFTLISCGTTTNQPTPPPDGGVIVPPDKPDEQDKPVNPGPTDKEVEFLTNKLKEFNSEDPVGYDFALFGLGVNR